MKVAAAPLLEPAVGRALAELLADRWTDDASLTYTSAWRRAALREGVEREEDLDEAFGYTFSPRSTRGATRA